MKRKIKSIFVDAHMFDNGFEGSASFIKGVYSALLTLYPETYKIYFGCFRPESFYQAFGHHPSIDVIPYKTNNRFIRLALDIPRITNSLRPNLAHFQYFTPLKKNCPWHVTIHDVLFNDFPQYFPRGYARIRNLLFPVSARRADLLSTVSVYSRDRLNYWYGCKPEDIVVLPNGADYTELGALSPDSPDVLEILSNQAGYFLCVSRFEPRKNQAKLLEAFNAGKYWMKGVYLVFVGSRTLPVSEFNEIWAKTPPEVRKYVKFLSRVPYTDMQLLNANALVSVYPSFAEGFGMPPIESAVYGTPTMCGNVTGMMEFDFLRPFFFDPTDFRSIQLSIDRVLREPTQAYNQMVNAMEVVRRRYSWSQTAETLHRAMNGVGSF